ncbi:MAG: methyl-accepting chemotaxis protein, partial [Gorillibacterium sp.]|nr:methyl-accepting chemotaxis protein [Gorillibacterium sp.]
MGFAQKITSAIISLLIIVGAVIGVFSYQTANRQVKEAVGIELVGCANITTGLVIPADVEKLLQGDASGLPQMEEKLNWTVAHKA